LAISKALNEAEAKGWTVIDMKSDFRAPGMKNPG
jgi:hypothetical protein